jgi:putative DNA primase/helicase
LNQRLAFYPLTDLGNGERFRDRNRGNLIYTEAFGWLYWDGRRWSREGTEQRVLRAAHDCARAIQLEARAIRDNAQPFQDARSRRQTAIIIDLSRDLDC